MNSCADRPDCTTIIYESIYFCRGYSFMSSSMQKDWLFPRGVALLHTFHLTAEVVRLAVRWERD